MPVTFTIKQVPDDIADALRQRALRNRRSLQRELLVVLEDAAAREWPVTAEARESREDYATSRKNEQRASRKTARSATSTTGRLTLRELWRRARELGPSSPGESVDIVRRDRDARSGH